MLIVGHVPGSRNQSGPSGRSAIRERSGNRAPGDTAAHPTPGGSAAAPGPGDTAAAPGPDTSGIVGFRLVPGSRNQFSPAGRSAIRERSGIRAPGDTAVGAAPGESA
jgi:hypothetical protein